MQYLSDYHGFRSWCKYLMLQESRAAHLPLHWVSTLSMHPASRTVLFPDRTPDLVVMGSITIYKEQPSCCWKSWTLTFAQQSRIGETSPFRLQSLSSVESATWQNTGLAKEAWRTKCPKAYAPRISSNHLLQDWKYSISSIEHDWTLCETLKNGWIFLDQISTSPNSFVV